MKVSDVIRLLEQEGWYFARQRGSHRQYRHPTKPGRVTVAAKPSDEVAAGTLGSIFRQAGIRSRGSRHVSTWVAAYERTSTGWSAYVPALPGLAATGDARPEVEQVIRDGIPLHLEGLAEDGLPIPDPASVEAEAVAV